MNFHDVYTREQTQAVAPPPRLITDLNCAEHRRQQRRLLIAEEDERAMAEWRCRQRARLLGREDDKRRAKRADRRRQKGQAISQCDVIEAGGESLFDSDDPRWEDIWLDTSDNTSEDDDDKDDSE